MPMPEYLFVVDATVDPSVEAEWNRWYNDVHVPEIVACPGFRQAARYVAEQDGQRHYLAIYEVASPDVRQSPEFQLRRGWAQFAPQVRWTSRVYRRIAGSEHRDGHG